MNLTFLSHNKTPGGDPTYFDKILMVASEKPFLTHDEESDLFKELKVASAERAKEIRDDIVTRNMRLVASIAKRFQNRGLDFDDVFQAGVLGLMHGVEKFDHTKGFRLSTYATWWIYQAIILEIQKTGRAIRIPVHVYSSMKKMQHYIEKYEEEHLIEPSVAEISEALHLGKEEIERALEASHIQMVSADRLIAEEGDIYSFLPSNDDDPVESVYISDVSERINNVFTEEFSEREVYILERRYGLNGNMIRTPDALAKELSLTRQRVQQIQESAERRLRNMGYLDMFKGELG